ncbi:MAG TPA: 1-deoxy-D-xylulose-5-phosphate synthase [Syntrophorhabdales bacterium]|nr:1-deoxy-D-xylulose-5-phosphate synthase [Syntrophorhabdales bacterium]
MLLETINTPQDIRQLTIPELQTLADEIRQTIIETVSKTGGHLSSNLGVVELTVALHHVFETPEAQIVWDVGHQCYPHKILTERKDRLWTIRQNGGLSGFPCRKESCYDAFDTGHASNSISVAVGLAEAEKKLGQSQSVIAVIGDGSLTGGMAFEALNHAGHLKTDVIVILNDNEMSISKNVGALSAHLNRIMTGDFVSRLREEIKNRLKQWPGIGDKVYKAARQLEEVVKGLVTPGILFEELGFTYIGPVDGHNLTHLIETLRNVKRLKGPRIVHIITKKGKGYEPAEADPARFHGVSKFDIATGASVKNGQPTFTDAFGDAMIQLAGLDNKVVAVTAAMCLGTGLEKFSQLFPDRFYDIGIAEQHGVTFAAGLACQGLKPFVAIYSTFLQRAYDQVIEDVCLQGLPVVFALDRSGLVGQDGPTHNGSFDISYLRHIPNMVVMSPKDENELKQMLYSAYRYGKPAAIRYPRGEAIGVPIEPTFSEIPIGTWEVLKEGTDITLMSCGPLVYTSLDTAMDLEKEGISCAVVNARFVKPMDREVIINLATHTRRVLTIEENTIIGGFGSGVMEVLSEEGIRVPVKRVGLPDRFLAHGTQKMLRELVGLDQEGIKKTVKLWLSRE